MFTIFWLFQLGFAEPAVDQERAKELFYNGQLLFDEGEFESAILAWERGYEITQLPAFLKNIALAHEKNENYSMAIDFLKQYRAFAPFEEQEDLKVWLTELEALQAKLVQESVTEGPPEKTDTISNEPAETEVVKTNPVENTSEMPVENTVPNTSKDTMRIWTLGGTAVLATSATVFTLRTSNLYNDLNDSCGFSGSNLNCIMTQPTSETLNQFNQAQNVSMSLWGLTAIGVGLSVWQWNQPVQVSVWDGGLSIGGRF